MTKHINLNNDWKFSNNFIMEMADASYDEETMKTVRLPHTNKETPLHYFDEKIYQFLSCYRNHIRADEEWRGKQALLTFEGVAHVAKVYINGKLVITHLGGYTAFTVDVASYLNFGEDNILAVEVDSRETNNLPPFGNVIDYLAYGGIYREVYLDIKEEISIEDAFIITQDVKDEILEDGNKTNSEHESKESETEINEKETKDRKENSDKKENVDKKEVALQITLNGFNQNKKLKLRHIVTDADNNIINLGVIPVTGQTTEVKFKVEGVKNWDIENPILYFMQLELFDDNAKKYIKLDEKTIRFGFRTCEFKEDGFYLNHKKIKLLGLNRHQSFPYVGYAMPKRMQQRDAEILKNELCVNAVRTSHYPQSKHFIDRCDELGLLVFTEIPGWQHIGDDDWKKVACDNVREMVLQYRNHPSIILWGVRINESQDDDEFYTKTNQIAHQLDPSRQTGGVRFLKKSNLLEDVYTYNDFLYNGFTKGLDRKEDVAAHKNAPYLVSEFNGHMYPTKPFDDEEHRLQHALRHACVLDALFEQEGIAGGFGWCMFDYNTHKDFGSGDRICYHGVMDMFRNPKLAAAVYASQSDLEDIFEISSSLDIGEHPACNTGDIYVFTNADSIKLYKNNTFIKEFYPNREKYPNLLHPPMILDDFVGDLIKNNERYRPKTAEALKKILLAVKKYGQNNLPLKYKLKMAFIMLKEHIDMGEGMRLYYQYVGSWGEAATTFRFEAVKENKIVKVIEKKPVNTPRLSAVTKDARLTEDETYDVAEIRITAIDENGNQLPYYQEPISLETWGVVELIGPKVISLKGGAGGTYIKTMGVKGEGGLKISQVDLGVTEIKFQVI